METYTKLSKRKCALSVCLLWPLLLISCQDYCGGKNLSQGAEKLWVLGAK